jgi:hypothetical protein
MRSELKNLLFVNKKKQKNFDDSGAEVWATAVQHFHRKKEAFYSGHGVRHRRRRTTEPESKQFLGAFFKKHCFACPQL